MKTAISLPDPLFERAEKLAEDTGRSRSQLYREALTEYLDRHDPQAVTRTLDAALNRIGDQSDPFVDEAARRVLAASEW